MNLPQFNAAASFGPATGNYQGRAVWVRSPSAQVLPMMASCTNCEVVGRFGSIRGVGERSCCDTVWTINPKTGNYEPVQVCWSEPCTPGVVPNPLMSFD